jgi:hypothetical protein
MEGKIDKLQLLKTRYLERIRDTERILAELKGKVGVIDELESESAKLESGESEVASEGATGTAKKYSETKLTEAVFDAVQVLGIKGISARKAATYILVNGFKPQGKNFIISVGQTLRRLTTQGKIETALIGGGRVYISKPQ